MIVCALRRPRMSTSPTTGSDDLAAGDDQVQVAGRLLEDLVGERLVGVGQRGVDRRLDVPPLERVLGAVVDLDRRAGRRRRARSVFWSRSITSGGITSAPSASPDSTLAIASSRESTRIGSTASNSSRRVRRWRRAAGRRGRSSPRRAARGWRTRPSASTAPTRAPRPTSSATISGYSTSSATSSGERRRICRSLSSSQRMSVAPAAQEAHERALEVDRVVLARRALQLRRRAGEQELAVGEHEQPVGVALGLGDVVRGVDDGRGARRARAWTRTPTGARAGAGRATRTARRAAAPTGRRAGRPRCSPAAGCRPRACRRGRRARSRRPGLVEHPATVASTSRDLLEPREEAQVLAHRELGVDRRLLRDPADLAAVERDGARGGLQRAGEDLQQRRLARAVRPDDAISSPAAAENETSWSARRSP